MGTDRDRTESDGAPPDSVRVDAFLASPNFGARANGRRPDSVVLHYTGMPTADGALAWLCNPTSEVSCHYFVFEDGRTVQLVREADRAWHAGRGAWQGETDMNSASIGVEIANPGHDGGCPPFPEAQVDGVIALLRDILDRRAIPARRVIAHSDMAPERKRDPGEGFPWRRLHEAGVAHWVEPAPVEDDAPWRPASEGAAVRGLQAQLALYGYTVAQSGILDRQTTLCVAAFQRRFRPARVDGLPDASTRDTLARLVATGVRGKATPDA
ncbi:MAG: N-acetylmuramoyl-L-alanine amidase [Hyphomicrobiales bacterium]|nr:N-acetylmuramoyl-L-alanine amidase [Hyphomicrobiales bacterium]MDE2018183.1 N-acetylmuramoyl-L-alanine amidase [Hyphomicrobiales bacterium]